MEDTKLIMEEIFKIVKEKEAIYYKGLYNKIDAEKELIDWARNRLMKDYGLITHIKQELSLTEKGEAFDSVTDYIDSLKPKKKPFDWYKPIGVLLTCLSLYLAFLNYQLKQDQFKTEQTLVQTQDSLSIIKKEFSQVQDSLYKLKLSIKTEYSQLEPESKE